MMHIQENISLKNYNTLHIDVNAKYFVKIENMEDLQELMKTEIWSQSKFFIL
jgi:UDP-N-acetylenolpyruvoylglucosamine reductase